jgi:hypothetical protein
VTIICGNFGRAVKYPDAGEGMCCYGAAFRGPQGCTCWEEAHDLSQAEPVPAQPATRSVACGDCAYRPDSPERRGEEGYAGDADTLDMLTYGDQPFWCHQGMRRVLALRHPSGVSLPGHPGHYDPPVRDRVPYKADGTPGDICAGWAARAGRLP